MRFQTLAVHSDDDSDHGSQPATPPVERAASWAYDSMAGLEAVFAGEAPGYFYGRDGSPTNAALEQVLARLEAASYALVYSSGMAAMAAVLAVAGRGRRILAAADLYGRSYRLLHDWLPGSGAEVRFLDVQDQDAVAAALRDWQPHLLVAETLSNPLVKVADVAWLVDEAGQAGCKTLIDNTFATPYLARPAALGADFTVESLTKAINGHGDVVGGAVAVRNEGDHRALLEQRSTFGATLDPQAAWLTLRGVRTLALRQRQQGDNAAQLASFLSEHPQVARVYYPGLPGHPGHERAARLFGGRGFGSMLAFDLAGAGRERAWQVMDRLRLARRAPTLGDLATLVSYPPMSSHRGLTPAQRAAAGIGEGLVRVSAGIEHCDDLREDFSQALS